VRELSQSRKKLERSQGWWFEEQLVASADLQAISVRNGGEPGCGCVRLDKRLLDVHVAACVEHLFRQQLVSLRRRAYMHHVDSLGAEEIRQGSEADRTGLYAPHFFQRRGVRIDDGGDCGIA